MAMLNNQMVYDFMILWNAITNHQQSSDDDRLFQCQLWEVELADELRRSHPKTMSFAILN